MPVGAVAGAVVGATAGATTAGGVTAGGILSGLAGGASLISNIASIFGSKSEDATSAIREQFGGGGPNVSGFENWQNVQTVQQSVLVALDGDTSAPEWLKFIMEAPTNQLDRVVSAGQRAIADYKARKGKEMPEEKSTIDLGTATATPPPMALATPDVSSAVNALTNTVGDLINKPEKPSFDYTPVLIGVAVIGVFFLLRRK